MRKAVIAVIIGLLAPLLSMAADGVPNIAGRWDFKVTTGDTEIQLNDMGNTEFETYLLQNGNTLSDIVLPTTDTTACDNISDSNVSASGTVSGNGNVTTVFTITGNGAPFTFTFAGKLSKDGLMMTGTWTTTATCSAAAGAHGNFQAWKYADISGLYTGAFDGPDMGTGPTQIPASINFVTESDKSVGGFIDAPQFTLDGTPNSPACFVPFSDGHTLHLISGYAAFAGVPLPQVSQQAGYGIEIFAVDAAGNQFFGLGGNMNQDGSHGPYTIDYGIAGGSCHGLGGGNAFFTKVKKHGKEKPPRPPRHGR
jgi:hypothetical protein